MSSIEKLYNENKLEVISVLEDLINPVNKRTKSDCDKAIITLSQYMEDIKYSKIIKERESLYNICKNGIDVLQKDKEDFSKNCNIAS